MTDLNSTALLADQLADAAWLSYASKNRNRYEADERAALNEGVLYTLANLQSAPTDHTNLLARLRQVIVDNGKWALGHSEVATIEEAMAALEASRPLTPSADYEIAAQIVERINAEYREQGLHDNGRRGFTVEVAAALRALNR